MNELDGLIGAETSPVELKDLVGTPLPALELPKAAMRNRAATVALLSDNPAEASNSYQLMLAQANEGSTELIDYHENQIAQRSTEEDRKTFMQVLSDPKIDMERKKALIRDMANNPIQKDMVTKLMTENAQKPSEGETIEAEDARINAVERLIGEVYRDRELIQGLINAHGATLENAGPKTLYEATVDIVAPLNQNMLMGVMAANKPNATWWDAVKAFALPGSEKQRMYEKLRNLPADARVEGTRQFLDFIQKNSNTLFANNNQFTQFRMATEALTEGGYTDVDKWLDNLAAVLDVVALGGTIRGLKTAKTVEKAVGAQERAVEAAITAPATPAARAANNVSMDDLAAIKGKPTAGAYDERIRALEEQKAKLLGEAGNTLDKGEVAALRTERSQIEKQFAERGSVNDLAKSIQAQEGITSKAAKEKATQLYAESKADYDAQIARIDSQLAANSNASSLTQRIADLEKKIETLKANNTEMFVKKNPLAEAIEQIDRNSFVSVRHPASPHEVIKLANPQRARDLFTAIYKSTDDTVAEGLTNTNRTQAIVNDVYPQAGTSSGKVMAQPVDIQRNLRKELQVDDEVYKAAHADLGYMWTPKEKAAIRANVVRNFEDANGLTMRENMGTIVTDEGNNLTISAVYGLREGDFKNAKQAFEQARYALRGMGVLDEEIEILARDGLNYKPVKLADVEGVDGSYLVRVNTRHEIDPTDIAGQFDPLTSRGTILDRMSWTHWGDHGSLSRYLMDVSANLDPKLTGPAMLADRRAAGFEKQLLEIANDYAQSFERLSKEEQRAVDLYHREANFNELKFDAGDLRGRGFSEDAIDAVRKWRKFWDGHFYLENLDVIRTMNAEGFMKLESKNAELYAKMVPKNQNIRFAYDASLDKVVEVRKEMLDELYEKSGGLAKLRRPAEFDGEIVEHVIVRNNPQEYLRKIRESDRVLNYREGYYQLHYNAPRFVDEYRRGADGNEIRRAIAVAGDTVEAEHFKARMEASAPPGTRYQVRGDERALRRGSDEWFDLNSSRGRIAQRHRGKLLEDGAGMNHLGDGSYILDPVSSAIRASRSIAGRTVNRPMLETAKARFLNKYKDILPPDGMGGVKFPSTIGEINPKGRTTDKIVGEARADFNYIRYLENGYINGIDSGIKQFLNMLSTSAGKRGFAKAERGINVLAEEANPMQAAKSTVFMATIGANPLRQLIVQPHQIIRMIGYNPTGMASGRVAKLMYHYGIHAGMPEMYAKLAKGDKYSQDFVKLVEDSGILAAVDKNNLVRGSLEGLADSRFKTLKNLAAPLQFMRKIGFDYGEMANSLGHLAAVYDKAISDGKKITDPKVRGEIIDQASALSYDMSFAGDFAYNQTAANVLLQFMQVPHKAMMQVFNRRLPLDVRMKMALTDAVLFGPPVFLISEAIGGDFLPDNPDLREALTYGLESWILNESLRNIFKDDAINIDFSSLAPVELQGMTKTIYLLLTEGPDQAWLNSPAGQLFAKDNGRIPNAIASLSRFFGISEPIGETPDSFARTMNEILKISSGWSNATKAWLMLETEKRMDAFGRPVSDRAATVEAYAVALGFGSANQRDMWKAIEQSNSVRKQFREDVLKDYKTILQYYQTEFGKGVTDPDQLQAVSSLVLKRYEGQPEALQIIREQLKKDLADPNTKLIQNMMKAVGLPEASKLKDSIRIAPITDDQKKDLIDMIDMTTQMREDIKEK